MDWVWNTICCFFLTKDLLGRDSDKNGWRTEERGWNHFLLSWVSKQIESSFLFPSIPDSYCVSGTDSFRGRSLKKWRSYSRDRDSWSFDFQFRHMSHANKMLRYLKQVTIFRLRCERQEKQQKPLVSRNNDKGRSDCSHLWWRRQKPLFC